MNQSTQRANPTRSAAGSCRPTSSSSRAQSQSQPSRSRPADRSRRAGTAIAAPLLHLETDAAETAGKSGGSKKTRKTLCGQRVNREYRSSPTAQNGYDTLEVASHYGGVAIAMDGLNHVTCRQCRLAYERRTATAAT